MEHGLLSRAVEYINRQRQKKRWQQAVTAMAAVVVFCTTYALILPAITLEDQVYCGQEEHVHEADCYGQVLTCDLLEAKVHTHTDGCYETNSTLVCMQAESSGHTHTDACRIVETHLACASTEEGHEHGDGCYTTTTTTVCGMPEAAGHAHGADCWHHTRTLVCTQSTEIPDDTHVHGEGCYGASEEPTCGLAEHEHEDACHADLKADRETARDWEKTLEDVELTDVFAEDVLAVAESQLGYTESETNYMKNDEGRKLGYSRYGAWYGDPYGDWCAMFVSFCLHYAEISAEDFPREASCQRWIDDLIELELYREAESYVPNPGDLIFFNWDEEPDSDHVGLVEEIVLDEEGNYKEIKTIEGNSSNKVQRVTYDWGDPSIMGYGDLGEAYRLWLEKQKEEVPEESGETEEPEGSEVPEVPEEPEPLTLTFENDQLTLTATYTPEAGIPADAELVVEDIQPNSADADYESHYRLAQEVLGLAAEPTEEAITEEEPVEEAEPEEEEEELTDFRLYDISIQSQGEKIVPETPVSLTLTVPQPEEEKKGLLRMLSDAVSGEDTSPEVSLIHFGQEGAEEPIVQTMDEGESGDLTATFALREAGLDAVVLAETRSVGSNPVVLFDGQMGAHKYYDSSNIKYGGAERRAVTVTNGTVTLPESLNSTGNYPYKIVGWYDIINNVYYGEDMLGQQIPVTKDTVFYPDYVAASYDIGQPNGSVVTNQPDTSDFVTTHVFDYNELFNIQSATYVGSALNLNPNNQSSFHTGNWTLNTNGVLGGFVFSDWIQDPNGSGNNPSGYGNVNGNGDGNIGRVFNLGATNSNNSENRANSDIGGSSVIPFYGNITSGLLNSSRQSALFTTQTARPTGVLENANKTILGREYLGTGDKLFSYNDKTGYYYYNSALNAAAYNQSQQRFYVYDQPEQVDNTYSLHDFLPFNYGQSVYQERNTVVDYWFGMKVDITFYLPDTVGNGETGNNKAANGEDMQFRFAGDDDVWVYVDGQPVLDMGGVHDVVYGGINFANGTVTTGDGGAANTANASNGYLPGVNGGSTQRLNMTLEGGQNHTLTIYYLERGASLSNCSIYFNIAPTYELELMKSDKENGQKLAGAEFAVYDDEACTKASVLHPVVNGKPGEQIENVFTTDAEGKILFWGLNPGRTYYIKETKSPDGYPDMSDLVIRLDLSAAGEPTVLLLDSTGTEWVYADAHNVQDLKDQSGETIHRVLLNVYNQKDIRGTKEVYVEKVWEGPPGDDEITVRLYANGEDTGRTIALNAGNNWKGVFYELPETDGNGEIQYTVREYPIPKGYRVQYEETTGSLTESGTTEGWVQVNGMKDGGTYLLVYGANALQSQGNGTEYMSWVSTETALASRPSGQAYQWTARASGSRFTLQTGQGYYLKLWYNSNDPNFYVNSNPGSGSGNYTDSFVVDSNGRIYYTHNRTNHYFTTLNHDGNRKSRSTTNQNSATCFAIYEWQQVETTVAGDPIDGWKITNYPIPEDGYMLPETGGPGVHWYILGGILLIAGGTLWYRKQEDGKEGTRTS